jgi:GTP-binding protein HflX
MPGPNIRMDVEIPYGRGNLLSRVMQHGIVENQEYLDEGTALTVRVDAELAHELQPFVTK